MNICYKLPVSLYDTQFYEKLKEKVEQKYKGGCCDFIQRVTVPKKSGRCILVERGISVVKYIYKVIVIRYPKLSNSMFYFVIIFYVLKVPFYVSIVLMALKLEMLTSGTLKTTENSFILEKLANFIEVIFHYTTNCGVVFHI